MEEPISPIPNNMPNQSVSLSPIAPVEESTFNLSILDHIDENLLDDEEKEAYIQEQESRDYTFILETFEHREFGANNNNGNISQHSFSMSNGNFRTIVLKKEKSTRKNEIRSLNFPELSTCYCFDYREYKEKKIITCSVISGENKIEVEPQASKKKVNLQPKLSVPQKEVIIDNILTQNRVLLMAAQSSIQGKQIPNEISKMKDNILQLRKTKKSSQTVGHQIERIDLEENYPIISEQTSSIEYMEKEKSKFQSNFKIFLNY